MTLLGPILFDLIVIAAFLSFWFLPRYLGLPGLFSAYGLLLIVGIVMTGVQLAYPEPPPVYGPPNTVGAPFLGMLCFGCLFSPISMLALWRRENAITAAKLKSSDASRASHSFFSLNPSISVYWLWFTIVFGVIAITPWPPFGGTYHPVAATYSRYEWYDNWQQVLVVHTLIATLLGFALATGHVVVLSIRGRPETAIFSLRSLFIVTGIFALICGWLRWLSAVPGVFIAVLLPLGGYFASKILAGAIARRIAANAEQRRDVQE